ncbi:unnamed protein product [Brachionus calyciflorus]|uniref:F5/8 type C domain-containing protein n=1 Tax=Brachionus calyciflorus TaxID=104777 RepID=A0A813RRV4_9BILA|nr:unnamed protein product [Brachionus calyciflorus]
MYKLRSFVLCFKLFLLNTLISLNSAQAPANMTITLNALGACATASNFKVGDSCVFEMIIQVPQATPTMMHVELFTSDNSTTTMAQLCKPTITIGSNYNLTTPPIPDLTSSNDNYQFDQAVIEFGVITNSGLGPSSSANSIVITFNVVIIDNNQPNGTSIWITSGAEYYDGDEIWIGQTALTFQSENAITETPTATLLNGVSSTSSSNNEIGKFGSFEAKLTLENIRSPTLILKAVSNDFPSNPVSVCSIHVKSAGWCYQCVDSTKAYIRSKYSKDSNSVTLDLGKIINLGRNNNSMVSNSFIDVFVTYKLSPNSKSGQSSTITLTANASGTTSTFTHTVNVISLSNVTYAPTPTITNLANTNPVSIYQAFNITLVIEFPSTFNNYLEVEAIPNLDTIDGKPRAKICSVVITSSGENLPCPKCMNTGSLEAYSQNSSLYDTYDGILWSLAAVPNYNLRTTADNLDVNKMTLSIIGQILDHSQNTQGSNVSIPLGVTFGNQTIWVTENVVFIGGPANYSSTNSTLPDFSISKADTGTYEASVKEPRAIYFDIYTKPGSVYIPMDVEIVMPEIFVGSNIPAATVCSVQVYYVGIYSVCAQQSFINNAKNGKISYLQRMISFKNDKAIVKLDPLCNSADPTITIDPIDGLVRFLIYFQLDDDPNVPSSNLISVGTKFTTDQIYIGSITYTKSATVLPTLAVDASKLYTFKNSTPLTANAGDFGLANYLVKIPPSSLNGYVFETTLTSTTSPGKTAYCTVIINDQGPNVPCRNTIKHNYKYGSDLIKNYGYGLAGPVCSINNVSTSVSSTSDWDDDSINVQIITRPFLGATGSYSVQLLMKDQRNNNTLRTEDFSWTIGAQNQVSPAPDFSLTNSSIFGVDPTEITYVSVNSSYLNFYKGQTSIIRFNLTLNERKFYQLAFNLSSTLPIDQHEVLRFFILDVGTNFPCSSISSVPTYFNGSKFAASIKIEAGELAYYAYDPLNLTASTITVEAHVRIPLTSTAGSTAGFTITPLLDGTAYPQLTETLTVNVLSPSGLISNVSTNHSYKFVQQVGLTVTPRQTVVLDLSLKIPPNANSRVSLNFTCVDQVSSRGHCHIKSILLKSFGQNVDGIQNEYKNNLIQTSFSKKALDAYFYNDSTVLDLGIITNTNYGQKIGKYDSNVDDLIDIQAEILIADDLISNGTLNFVTTASFNSDQMILSDKQSLIISRSGTERPFLIYNVSFLNATNVKFSSNSKLVVLFEMALAPNSTAEAYDVKTIFYLPKYIQISAIEENNANYTFSQNDSAIIFIINRLHFEQNVFCKFSIIFDQSSDFSNLMNQFGIPPTSLKIPYNIVFKKIIRTGDTVGENFNTNFGYISFMPFDVAITSIPLNPLKSLINFDSPCRIASSVPESTINNLFTTGWTFGYRSNQWLISHGSYITISFVDTAKVSQITFQQLSSDAIFRKFRVAFSNDNLAYAHLPESSTTTLAGQEFTYSMPNKFITCKYLRIYITDVATPADLETKKTGFIIKEIKGEFTKTTTLNCPANTVSSFYKPRSYLYVPSTLNLFVCDETTDRSSSECYSSSNTAPASWIILSKTVSTIVFYVKELNSGKEFLYGVAKNKVNFVRSDDNGVIWKIISSKEFNDINSLRVDTQIYETYTYVDLPLSTLSTTSGSWHFTPKGISFGGTLRFDWFN